MIFNLRYFILGAFAWPALMMGQPVLGLNPASGLAGTSIATSLSISGATASTGPSALQFALVFQSADFSSVTVSAGPAATAAGKSVSCNVATGRIRCAVWGMNKSVVGNGAVATVTVVPSLSSALSSRPISLGELASASTGGAALPINASAAAAITIVGSTPTLSSLICNPSSIGAGASSACTVALSGLAAGAMTVAISDNSPVLTVPASVTIPAGKASATFTAQAAIGASSSTAVITGSLNGVARTTSLSIASIPTLISLKCYPNPIGPGASATCTLLLSSAVAANTVVTVSDDTPSLTVPASVTVAAGQNSTTFVIRAGNLYTDSIAAITAKLNGASTVGKIRLIASPCPCSIFEPTSAPKSSPVLDTVAIELGVKFRSKVAGSVTGIRFYKHTTNTGAHAGSLWTQQGVLIARANFTNETASGWQTVSFSRPIPISANTTYVASYRSPTGRYSADYDYFATAGVEKGSLYALRNGEQGPNGVYWYGNSAFPTSSYRSANYWVDVVFTRTDTSTITEVGSEELSAQSLSIDASREMTIQTAETVKAALLPESAPASLLDLPENESVRPGRQVSFLVNLEDAQGNPVAVTPTRLPPGGTFDDLSHRLQWTPSADQVGDQVLAFRATNAAGEITEGQSKFTVGWGQPEIDAASASACSPLSIGKVRGNWLADEELSDPSGASYALGETRVRVNGLLVPVLHTHPREVEFQCPADAPGSALSISVETALGTTTSLHTTMLAANPVILNSQPAGEGLLMVRATGISVLDLTSGEVKLNGVPAEIQEAAATPGEAGVTTIYVKVPENALSGQTIPVQLEVRSLSGQELVSNSASAVVAK